jgi:hypothetical protein
MYVLPRQPIDDAMRQRPSGGGQAPLDLKELRGPRERAVPDVRTLASVAGAPVGAPP